MIWLIDTVVGLIYADADTAIPLIAVGYNAKLDLYVAYLLASKRVLAIEHTVESATIVARAWLNPHWQAMTYTRYRRRAKAIGWLLLGQNWLKLGVYADDDGLTFTDKGELV